MSSGRPNVWKVVGGGANGGLLVRTDISLTSAPAWERLATGAMVRQVWLEGGRLCYRKLTGQGPAYGWVSVKTPDKELLVLAGEKEAEEALDAAAAFVFGADQEPLEAWGELRPPRPKGRFVPHETGRPKLPPWTPQLAKLPPELRSCTPWKQQLKGKKMNSFMGSYKGYLLAIPDKDAAPKGHFYGIPLPHTLEMIDAFGAEWLTQAMHLAGTLPKDNSVVSLEVRQASGGTACRKARLTLQYAKPGEDLHAELFVKYPSFAAPDNDADLANAYKSSCLWNVFGPEIDFARILSAGAPMRCPKYYFGDINMECSIFILITECFDLPDFHVDYGPFELEAIPRKSVEYTFDDAFAYYASMVRCAAQLGAWCFNGKFGADILQIFPPPEQPPMLNTGTRSRAEKFLYFLREDIPHWLPSGLVDGAFESTLLDTLTEVEKAQRDIFTYLYAQKDMVGLVHQNMQSDNATFWRDEAGTVQAGFIDWGKVKQDTFGWEMACGFYAMQPPELLAACDLQLLRLFLAELEAQGGPRVAWETMLEHYRLCWCLLAIDVVANPDNVWAASPYTAPGALRSVPSCQDPRVWHLPDVCRGLLACMLNLAHLWKRLDMAAFFADWRKANPSAKKDRKAG